MDSRVRQAIEVELDARIVKASRLSGGDINDAFRLELADGRAVFAKTNARAAASMFPSEARGLRFLAEPQVIRVPRVLAVSDAQRHDVGFLVLEYVESARPKANFDEDLGRKLAALHRAGAANFGLDHDNFIGRLPQSNTACASWAEFYRTRRLEPQLRLAESSGHATQRMQRGFEKLFARLTELVGPNEPPARLHGDLWGGNLHVDDHGHPCLIDPAVYGGHREMDLAMMKLFGGFGERVFSAYGEAFPLAPGHPERVALYQLYPLMVHVNLFGGGYAASVERALASYI
jgi:fructosamine-3-kinase